LKEVKTSIYEELPEKFGIIFDGWSCDGEHYIAIFATWVNSSGGVCERLLACGVQDLPENPVDAENFGFTAEDIGDYFADILSSFNCSFEAIEFICGDNASVNGRLATLIQDWLLREKQITRTLPLVGCASHRLNLAVQSLYAEGTAYYHAVEKVHTLMVELGTLKNRYKLAAKTQLCPVKRNDTRWGSQFSELKRYVELQTILLTCAFSTATKRMFLSAAENYLITDLLEILYKCELTNKFLQTHDAHEVTLLSVRIAFDRLIDEVPALAAKIGPDADIVQSPAFEKAIIKLQKGEPLSPALKTHVTVFKDAVVIPGEAKEELTFAQEIALAVENSKRNAARAGSGYRSTLHVSPTSNIVERLFSRSSIIMRPHRRCMDPSTCEMLIMLRCNKDMWSQKTLQDIIDTKKEANREAARKRVEERTAAAAEYLDDE
jgi:hypothetical protein